jgi:hypothetical protein
MPQLAEIRPWPDKKPPAASPPSLTYSTTTIHLHHVQRKGRHHGTVHDGFETRVGYDNLWCSGDDLQVRAIRGSEDVQITSALPLAPARTVLKTDCLHIHLFRPSPSVS